MATIRDRTFREVQDEIAGEDRFAKGHYISINEVRNYASMAGQVVGITITCHKSGGKPGMVRRVKVDAATGEYNLTVAKDKYAQVLAHQDAIQATRKSQEDLQDSKHRAVSDLKKSLDMRTQDYLLPGASNEEPFKFDLVLNDLTAEQATAAYKAAYQALADLKKKEGY